MSSYKDILKRTCRYVGYILLYLISVIIIGFVAGLTSYIFVDKDCDYQLVKGCMYTGMSEQACKDKIYRGS